MPEPKFLLDENIPRELLLFLQANNYDAIIKPKGLMNGRLAYFSKIENRTLITQDKDFYNYKFTKDKIHSIILIKIFQHNLYQLTKLFSILLTKIENFEGKIIYLGEDTFNIDDLPTT